MHPQLLPAISYFLSAAVAVVAGYRASGKAQRAGMASAGIGFILLGVDRIVSAKDSPSRALLIVAGSLMLAGIFLYWFSYRR
jgi:hypothetical protein